MDGREPGLVIWARACGVLARDVGFPAVVAAFVLWRVDAAVRDLVVETVRTRAVLVELVRRRCPVIEEEWPGVRRGPWPGGEGEKRGSAPAISGAACAAPWGSARARRLELEASGYRWVGLEGMSSAAPEGAPRWVFVEGVGAAELRVGAIR